MRMRQVKKQRMARKFCHNPVVDFLYTAAEEKFMILNVTHFGSCFNNFVLQLEQLPSNLRQTEHVNLYLIIPRLTNMSTSHRLLNGDTPRPANQRQVIPEA